MGSLFTLVGLGLLYSSAKSIRRAGLLASRGQVVSGTIIDRWTVTDSEGDRTYVIAYRFTVPLPDGDSRPFTRAEYNKAAYDSYLPGNGVRVRYLPENPTLCRLERN